MKPTKRRNRVDKWYVLMSVKDALRFIALFAVLRYKYKRQVAMRIFLNWLWLYLLEIMLLSISWPSCIEDVWEEFSLASKAEARITRKTS